MTERGPTDITAMRSASDNRLGNIVRHKHDRLANALPDVKQNSMHAPPRQRVERGKRLVHQQHLRLNSQAAGDLQALPHST